MEIYRLTNVNETEAKAIYNLSNQLGYANDFYLLFGRLETIVTLKDNAIFIAKVDGEIVGWLHCLICCRVESPLFIEIAGLVVDENIRRQQIGKNLIEASKNWGKKKGISILRVRCNIVRTESHRFYSALGFSSNKEQKVFELSL